MSTIVLYKLYYIEYNNTHTKAIKHWQQRSKNMSHFKNIKVNYTDFDGKRTSTTINFAICENLYWKKVDIETRRKLIEEENYQELQEKERKLITETAQEFINNLLKSQKEDAGSIRGTSQYGIESNMLMELMK